MIFAGDQWIQYPVKDLYDKGIMLMAILTARDMYEKGQQEIKDFNIKYGDFLTPIQKDQDWYNENVTGKMQDVINNLYANGIDPVRSAEGRAAISQLVNTMPVGDIAKIRTSAAAANEYLKNKAILQSKGLWNPELESQILGGKSVEDWDTMGSGQIFTRTSPTEYQDLNQFTSHIFDNIKDSYIGTRDGYDYFGVTANDLMNSLTPDTLGGLLNSDLGRFHYNNARNDLLARGIENPTNDQIMRQFRNNIVAANNERIHENRIMNEQYKLNREHASRMAAARERNRNNGDGGNRNNNNAIGWTKRQKTAIMLNYNNSVKNPTKNITTPSGLYKILQTTPLGADKTTALAFASGISDPEQIQQGINSKRLPVMFGGNDLNLTKKRQYEIQSNFVADPNTLGSQKIKHITPALPQKPLENIVSKRAVNKFNTYLKQSHVSGYIPSTDVTVNYSVNNGNDVYDVNTYIRVNKSQLDSYFKNNDAFVGQGSEIGLIAVLKDGKRVEVNGKNKGKLVWDNIEYIDIPSTRTIESVGYGNSVLDTYHDAITLGKSTGTKRQPVYESRDDENF